MGTEVTADSFSIIHCTLFIIHYVLNYPPVAKPSNTVMPPSMKMLAPVM